MFNKAILVAIEEPRPSLEAISKKPFRPISRRPTSIGVDASFQILDIREYVCGLNLGLALISNEKPNFEMLLM